MTRLLIIQPDCRSYRIPFFKKLSERYDITLLHFGAEKFKNDMSVRELYTGLKKARSLKYITGLKGICENYDVVIAVFDPHWLNAFFLPLLTDTPVIFWGHGTGESSIATLFRKFMGSKAQSLITYDEKGKENLVKLGLNSNKLFVAPNTIHIKNAADYSSHSKNSILFVGRLQQRKELDTLIKSFSLIVDDLPEEIILKIIGDGAEIKLKLKKIACDLGISDRVVFVQGTTDDEKLAEHFKNAYCYASPGAVGLGVLHSFAYGIPIITFKNKNHGPEVSNIDNKVNGVLVEGDKKAFSRAMLEMVESDNYRNYGKNAYNHYSQNRTIDVMVRGFEKAIKYAIN